MSLFVDAKYRSDKTEIMDDFSIDGPVLHDTLDKLSTINKWLGGTKVTINGLKKLLKEHPKQRELTIVDLGCGDGDMLRKTADFAMNNGYTCKLIGIDANEHSLQYARDLSKDYPSISFLNYNIFSEKFKLMEYDIVLSTLFLHHFTEQQLIEFLQIVYQKVSVGIVVNDLHRHPIAYLLFNLLCIFVSNRLVKEDGLTSILRGFKRKELESITSAIGARAYIRWKWAFRYQWIIPKNT